MSFSSLVQDLALRDGTAPNRQPRPPMSVSTAADDRTSHISRAMSYASTAATSVSISGEISSQLHGGYYHPLARSWQAERQLTKVRAAAGTLLQAAEASDGRCVVCLRRRTFSLANYSGWL